MDAYDLLRESAYPMIKKKASRIRVCQPVCQTSQQEPVEKERDDIECSICYSAIENDCNLWKCSECKHVIHQRCVEVWFKHKNTCPLCRTERNKKEQEQDHRPLVYCI